MWLNQEIMSGDIFVDIKDKHQNYSNQVKKIGVYLQPYSKFQERSKNKAINNQSAEFSLCPKMALSTHYGLDIS